LVLAGGIEHPSAPYESAAWPLCYASLKNRQMDDGAGTALRSGLSGRADHEARRHRPILDVHDVKQLGPQGAAFPRPRSTARAGRKCLLARLGTRREDASQSQATAARKGDVQGARARSRRRVGAFVTVCGCSPDLVGHLALLPVSAEGMALPPS
jgi:hypothetical protein